MYNHRNGERRLSVDLIAQFKERHFSRFAPSYEPQQPSQGQLKQDENEAQHEAHINASPMYDMDPTPRPRHIPFTPALLDPNSSSFAALADQPPAYFTTPTPSVSNMNGFHLPSSDMNTFTASDSLDAQNSMDLSPQPIWQSHFEDANFLMQGQYSHDTFQNYSIPGSVVGPVSISESSSNYGTPSGTENTDSDLYAAHEIQSGDADLSIHQQQNRYHYGNFDGGLQPQQFRFLTVLEAKTAMLKHPGESHISYLNKRQAYTISVTDTSPIVQNNEIKRYRTTVRVAFDHEEGRRAATARWALWRQGRAIDDDLPLDRLRAIDFDASETRAVIEKHANIETSLSTAATQSRPNQFTVTNPDMNVFIDDSRAGFDRFTITWSSRANKPVLHFIVRFIVLSTDFSHSKGTKGFVIRLISKTEYLGPSSPDSEICFCRVQSFRDKGAERKMQNDREALEGQIKRLKMGLQKLKMGIPDGTSAAGKKKSRRRSADSEGLPRRGRRDWSLSASPTSTQQRDEEVRKKMDKLRTLEARFATVQPVNVFCLPGDENDDPCAPASFISLDGDDVQEDKFQTRMMKLDSQSSRLSGSGSESSPIVPVIHPLSPTNPAPSLAGIILPRRNGSVRVQAATKEIDAVDVNPYYVSMPRPTINPALCLYITPAQLTPKGDLRLPTPEHQTVYYAVYVPERNASSVSRAIAAKMNIDLSLILSATIISQRGFHIMLDDDVVREMHDSQQMKVTVREVATKSENEETVKPCRFELLLAF